MKKDEAWLEKIKERLDEYTEPVPSGGWERLERDLPPARKVVPLRRWMTAVAALLVGAASFIAIRLADKPVPDEPAALESPVLARHFKQDGKNYVRRPPNCPPPTANSWP